MAELPVLLLKLQNSPVLVELKDTTDGVEFLGLHPGGFLHQGQNPPQSGATSKATVKFIDGTKNFHLANNPEIPPGAPVVVTGCPPDFC